MVKRKKDCFGNVKRATPSSAAERVKGKKDLYGDVKRTMPSSVA
jgi:hypothetical protein